METGLIILTILIWWSVVLVCLSVFLAWNIQTRGKPTWYELLIIVSWPFFIPFALIYATYTMSVASTKRIRQDLKNRKMLREFDIWLREHKEKEKLTKE